MNRPDDSQASVPDESRLKVGTFTSSVVRSLQEDVLREDPMSLPDDTEPLTLAWIRETAPHEPSDDGVFGACLVSLEPAQFWWVAWRLEFSEEYVWLAHGGSAIRLQIGTRGDLRALYHQLTGQEWGPKQSEDT